MRLVVFRPEVSSIVEAAAELSDDVAYAHSFPPVVEPVVRSRLVREVVLVSNRRNLKLERLMARYGVRYRYKGYQVRWYEGSVARHLVEPRIRELGEARPRDEYGFLLSMEYRTLSLLGRMLAEREPVRVGGFTYMFARVPVPTPLLAYLLYARYGGHVFAASRRDTGVAFTCITTRDTAVAIQRRLEGESGFTRLTSDSVLTGFIVSFPESPLVLDSVLRGVLGEVEAAGTVPAPPKDRDPYVRLLLGGLSYASYAKTKAALSRRRIQTVESGGRLYTLFSREPSPLYTRVDGGGYTLYKIYLPPPWGAAVRTEEPAEIMVDGEPVKPERVEKTERGLIHYLPDWAARKIAKQVLTAKVSVLAVFKAGGG